MAFPRRHDRYVLSAFWTHLGAVVLFFTVVVLVLDLSERLARLLRHWGALSAAGREPAWLLLEFYATFVPFVWMKVVPFCVPAAAALALSRLARRNELVPLVTSGVSSRRVLVPLVLSGVAVAGLLVGVREAVAPTLGRRQLALGRLLTRGRAERITRVPHLADPGGARLSMDAYLPGMRRMERVIVTLAGPSGLELRWYPVLDWEPGRGRWVATRGGEVLPIGADPTGTRAEIEEGEAAPLEADATLVEVSVTERASLGLSLRESRSLVRASPDDPKMILLHEEQWTGPLSSVVLLLLALPFCFRLDTRSAIPGLLVTLAVGALYYAATILTRGVGAAGDWNPVVVAWTPTVLFGSLGAALVLGLDR